LTDANSCKNLQLALLAEMHLSSQIFPDCQASKTIDRSYDGTMRSMEASLRFDYRNLSVVVAGDSVTSGDFRDDRRMYYNVPDNEESRRTMDKLNSLADIIIPGHDNYFFNI